MSLALVAGAFLVIGGAPAKSATFSIKAAKPAAARLASATPEAVSPREAIADRDTLDLQLD